MVKYRQADQGAYEAALKKIDDFEVILEEKDDLIKKMSDQLAWLRRKCWQSNSERYIPQDPNQGMIDFDGLDIIEQEQTIIEQTQQEIIKYTRTTVVKKNKQVRLSLPEKLLREKITLEPEGIDDRHVRIGEEITEVLEIKPGELFVRQFIRPKDALKTGKHQNTESGDSQTQEQKAVIIAPLPALPLPRSNAGARLLAWILVNKYHYHIPFHRMIRMLQQPEFTLPASTINGWFAASADLADLLPHQWKSSNKA